MADVPGILATAASRSRAWLLVEHPGPWPPYVAQMSLPPAIDAVVGAASARGVRVQLIRRPRARRTIPPLRVYAGWTVGDDAWLEGRELADPRELTALDLDALAEGHRPGFGEPATDPVFLVCTHGRRNAACARLGRPVATALFGGAAPGEVGRDVWETTHVGGDQFAANLVCLPHGVYYGHMTPKAAAGAVSAYRRGEVVLDHYRGRAGVPAPLQAAEHFVRRETGLCRVPDVAVASSGTGEAVTEALVRAGDARYRVVVEAVTAPPTPLCGGGCAESRESYRLLALFPLTEASLGSG